MRVIERRSLRPAVDAATLLAMACLAGALGGCDGPEAPRMAAAREGEVLEVCAPEGEPAAEAYATLFAAVDGPLSGCIWHEGLGDAALPWVFEGDLDITGLEVPRQDTVALELHLWPGELAEPCADRRWPAPVDADRVCGPSRCCPAALCARYTLAERGDGVTPILEALWRGCDSDACLLDEGMRCAHWEPGRSCEDGERVACAARGVLGVCADEGALSHCRDGAWTPCAPSSHPAYEVAETRCDGLDNDCDGAIDEMDPGPLAARQAGVCAGSRKLCGGRDGWLEPSGDAIPGFEFEETLCDGADNDCDGSTDEALEPPRDAELTGGVCSGRTLVCAGAGGWQEPNYHVIDGYQANESACDGLDNDCDGSTDEVLAAPPANRQGGVCANRVKVCGGVEGWQEPDYGQAYEEQERRCDGKDNDCDGASDEDLVAPPAELQAGVCAGQVKTCAGADGWQEPIYADIKGFEAEETRCDGLDNDCDGIADERDDLETRLADVQEPAACRGRTKRCVNGEWREPPPLDVEDGCDGIDNDCDGTLDEDFERVEIGCSKPATSEGEWQGARLCCSGEVIAVCHLQGDSLPRRGPSCHDANR